MTFPDKTVYLAGPISGLTHDAARLGWRKEFVEMLQRLGLSHIHCNSPMRGKEFLKDHGILSSGHDYPDHPMATAAGITTRDYNDVKSCDAMIACFFDSNGKVSAGTFMEYGFAHALQKPVIAVGPPDDPNIAHLMAARVMGYRVDTLAEAGAILAHLLTPGV